MAIFSWALLFFVVFKIKKKSLAVLTVRLGLVVSVEPKLPFQVGVKPAGAVTRGIAALTCAERGPSSFPPIASRYPSLARKAFFSREKRGMLSTENVSAKAPGGVHLRRVGFLGGKRDV